MEKAGEGRAQVVMEWQEGSVDFDKISVKSLNKALLYFFVNKVQEF